MLDDPDSLPDFLPDSREVLFRAFPAANRISRCPKTPCNALHPRLRAASVAGQIPANQPGTAASLPVLARIGKVGRMPWTQL
jgi:hypothetical protein